jgi:hypothetical protein
MKVVIRRKVPKGRVPHRPTKVERLKVRYDRKQAKQSVRKELREDDKAT